MKSHFEFSCMNCLASDVSRDVVRRLYLEYIANSKTVIDVIRNNAGTEARIVKQDNIKLEAKVKQLEARNRELENDMRIFAQTMNKYK